MDAISHYYAALVHMTIAKRLIKSNGELNSLVRCAVDGSATEAGIKLLHQNKEALLYRCLKVLHTVLSRLIDERCG